MKIEKENKSVKIIIDVQGFSVHFSYEQGNEFNATLLKNAVVNIIENKIKGIRKCEYEQGYLHGKNHKRKHKYFSPQL